MYQVTYYLVDNKGNKAQFGFKLASDEGQGVSFALALDRAAIIAELLTRLSDAHVTGYKVSRTTTMPGLPAPSPSSNIWRRCQFLFRDDATGRRDSVTIPSYRTNLPFDTTGPYRAIRIRREGLLLSGLLDSVQGLVAGTVDRNGVPFPPDCVVGVVNGVEEYV
jgi:hypothetical protein